MKFIDLLNQYMTAKTRVIVNGHGEGHTKGTIIAVNEDFIDFELLDVQTLKGSTKEKQKREVKHIPINQICDLSEGEKEHEVIQGLAELIKNYEPAKVEKQPA